MMKNNDKRKGNNAKKILPAAGMLALSASMLATSTYAWFTMSREVEVNNIQMTATVPEDIQISLGNLAINSDKTTAAAEADNISLANSTGVLLGNADDGGATAPVNSWDWSSSADISAYYKFGKLMPASSRDGAVIYYTADATGTGRTVNDVAKYFAANNASGPFKSGGTAAVGAGEDSAKTTLHAYTSRDATGVTDTWFANTYEKAKGWDDTNDDGYYVDIPIWLHSSATEDINVSVAGYVLPGSTDATNGKTQTALELYRSVRVAILNGDTQGIKANKSATASDVTVNSVCVANNVLPLADAWDLTKDGTNTVAAADALTHAFKAINGISNPFTGRSIVDSGIYLERNGLTSTDLYAVDSLTKYTSAQVDADLTGHITTNDYAGTYEKYETYNGTAPIATIKANTTTDAYGDAKKLIIRVWLDGEDTECWNDNAGQDWAISLRFTKVDIPNT
jgi:hypothetical protein